MALHEARPVVPPRAPVTAPSPQTREPDRAEQVDGSQGAVTSLLTMQRRAGNQAVVARLGGGPVQRLAAGTPVTRPTARLGSSGEHVGVLQQKLNATRSASPPLVVDAQFGSKTATAAKAFQSANALTPDAVVGKLTWGA